MSKLRVWCDEVSGAPWELEEFAHSAVGDLPANCELTLSAQRFLDAKEEFEELLDTYGVSLG